MEYRDSCLNPNLGLGLDFHESPRLGLELGLVEHRPELKCVRGKFSVIGGVWRAVITPFSPS